MDNKFTQTQLLEAFYQIKRERDAEGSWACKAACYLSDRLKKYIKEPEVRLLAPYIKEITPFPNIYLIAVNIKYGDFVSPYLEAFNKEKIYYTENELKYSFILDISSVNEFKDCPVKHYKGKVHIYEEK